MSNIKISELESTQKIDNEDLLMVVQENKNKKIKFSDFFPKTTIELLTVSATAPAECNTGDKYYNTTTSKIYTSTAENIWGTEEENPTSLYLYVDLEHKELYYFNGTTFVSYGGGSGGTAEVIQETGTANETNVYSAVAIDNKIETNIVTGQEVATNEYIDGYRVYVKKIDFTFNSDLSNWQLIDTISNFNKLVKIYGSVVASETETSNILSYYNNEGSTSYINPQTGEVRIKHNYSYVNNKPATVTIYYTKNS